MFIILHTWFKHSIATKTFEHNLVVLWCSIQSCNLYLRWNKTILIEEKPRRLGRARNILLTAWWLFVIYHHIKDRYCSLLSSYNGSILFVITITLTDRYCSLLPSSNGSILFVNTTIRTNKMKILYICLILYLDHVFFFFYWLMFYFS